MSDEKKLSTEAVLAAVNRKIWNSERARDFVLHQLHGDIARCPWCRKRLKDGAARRFWLGEKTHCSCGKQFRPLSGTSLEKISLSSGQFQVIILFAALVGLGVKKGIVCKVVGIDEETYDSWKNRLKIG